MTGTVSSGWWHLSPSQTQGDARFLPEGITSMAEGCEVWDRATTLRMKARERLWTSWGLHAPRQPVATPPPGTASLCKAFTDFGFAGLYVHGSLEKIQAQAASILEGLTLLAAANGMQPSEIGGGHLLLVLGDQLQEDMAGAYDPLTHAIHVSLEEEEDSFAHEWWHALDMTRGMASGTRTFATEQEPLAQTEHKRPSTPQEYLWYYREVIEGLLSSMNRLVEEAPSHTWRERMERRAKALEQWAAAVSGPLEPDRLDALWQRWRTGNRLLWNNVPAPGGWHERLERWQERCERLLHLPPRALSGWAAWALVRDEGYAVPYWSAPHEMAARAMHAVMAKRIERPVWGCGTATDADFHPTGAELVQWEHWWARQAPEWRNIWRQRQTDPLHWAGRPEEHFEPCVMVPKSLGLAGWRPDRYKKPAASSGSLSL